MAIPHLQIELQKEMITKAMNAEDSLYHKYTHSLFPHCSGCCSTHLLSTLQLGKALCTLSPPEAPLTSILEHATGTRVIMHLNNK